MQIKFKLHTNSATKDLLPPQVDDRNENNAGQIISIFNKHNSNIFQLHLLK